MNSTLEFRPSPVLPNIAVARAFIEALAGKNDARVTFQTFDDTGQDRRNLVRVLHGTLVEHARTLRKLNDLGAGVFVTVNETDGHGRQARNIVALRALFVDGDNGALPSDLALRENIRVTSASGQHAYWLLESGQELARFRHAQKALIAALGTDDKVHDLPRVMRLPGFLHRKATPFLVTFEKTDAPRRTIDEVLAAFPSLPEARGRGVAIGSGAQPSAPLSVPDVPQDVAIKRARSYLARVPGAVEGQGGDSHTFKVACALVRGFALDDAQALTLLADWNATCAPPWKESELVAKLDHARKYGQQAFGALLATESPGRDICLDDPPPNLDAMDNDAAARFFALGEGEEAQGGPMSAVANEDASWAVCGAENDNADMLEAPAANGDVGGLAEVTDDMVRQASKDADSPEEEAGYRYAKVRDALPEADVCAGMVVPYGYKLSKRPGFGLQVDGACTKAGRKKMLAGQTPEDVPIAGFPIIIKSRLVDRTDNSVRFELACLIGDQWITQVVDRERTLNTRHIIELAKYDFPVNSTNALDIVRYLAAFDNKNRWAIPTRACTTQMGWHRSAGADVFVAGTHCFTPDAKTPPVKFVGDSAGDVHLADCVRSEGSFDGWVEALRIARKYPRVELGVYAALATPLLKVVGAPSFAIDWCAESSTGKTTTMKLAASVWTVPDERAHDSLIHSWNTTQVGLERLAATLSGLPLFMDETKQAPNGPQGRSIVPQCIYQITNGQGKARGAVEGRRKTVYWNTLLLTTGEKAAVDHSKDAGPAARVLTLWGAPFGGVTDDVHKIEDALSDNYGHAGPLFTNWVVSNREAMGGKWRDLYQGLRRQFVSDLGDKLEGGVAVRLAKYLALLELTARLVHESLGLPWPFISCVDGVLDAVMEGGATFDRPSQALIYVYERAVAAKGSFYHCHDRNRPPAEFHGYWKVREVEVSGIKQDDYNFIGFLEPYLIQVLKSGHFDVEPTLKLWHERGWLQATQGRRGLRVRINGDMPYVYAVKKSAIEEVLGAA